MRIDCFVRWLIAAALVVAPAAADAQIFRAYLSSSGNDSNPCTLPQPCRLMPAALAAVADGGEIWILNSANYNASTVNISKSVSVLAEPGAIGSIVASGGPAITISGADVRVALTNLVIVPLPGAGGTFGVSVNSAAGALVVIDKVSFSRLPLDAVFVSTPATVRISNSSFVDLGNNAIAITAGATADISNVKMSGVSQFGVIVESSSGTTQAAVTDSTIVGASNCGLFSHTTGGTSQIFATRTTISGSSGGACSQGGVAALLSLNACSIQGNTFGVVISDSSKMQTFSNNAILNNGTNVTNGSLTPATLQ